MTACRAGNTLDPPQTNNAIRLRGPRGRRKAVNSQWEAVRIMVSARAEQTPTGWVGWIGFAAVVLFLNGIFSIVQGLAALIGPDTYYVASKGNLAIFNVAGWGWTNIIIGVLLLAAGGALATGRTWARVIAVILAIVSAVAQLLLVPVQPWWSFILIGVDVLVIYAVVAHGNEMREA